MGVGRRSGKNERGFTLLELLVVVIIIAILAAIAIPVFFRQRDKGFVAQSQSALANARILSEAFYVENGGSYLDPKTLTLLELEDQGLRRTGSVLIVPFPEDQSYCIVAINGALPPGHEWEHGTVSSTSGAPVPGNHCVPEDD